MSAAYGRCAETLSSFVCVSRRIPVKKEVPATVMAGKDGGRFLGMFWGYPVFENRREGQYLQGFVNLIRWTPEVDDQPGILQRFRAVSLFGHPAKARRARNRKYIDAGQACGYSAALCAGRNYPAFSVRFPASRLLAGKGADP